MPGPTSMLVLALVVPYVAAAARLARALGGADGRWRLSSVVFGILVAASFLLFFTNTIPIIVLYLGIWGGALLSFGIPNRFSKRSVFIANASTLCLVLACSLLLFGYLSILEATSDGANILKDGAGLFPRTHLLFAFALVLACTSQLGLAHGLAEAYPATEQGDRALTQFHAFVFFGVVYEMLDLVPFLLDTWFDLMPYFLFGGAILLALFFVVFSASTMYLGAETLRKSEDIALERRKRDEELRMRLYQKQATIDPLTGLKVRRIGHERLISLEESKTPYHVAFIDMNNLKEINDAHGHAMGDLCLQTFARALAHIFPESDVVRWGGDEFLVIAEADNADSLESRLEALNTAVHAPAENLTLHFCYGMASSVMGEVDTVLRCADDAMYRRKHAIHQAECVGGAE